MQWYSQKKESMSLVENYKSYFKPAARGDGVAEILFANRWRCASGVCSAIYYRVCRVCILG